MNTQNLKEKFDAFRNHPTTQIIVSSGKQALTMVVMAWTVKAITYIAVEGTKALISEINTKVNKSNN